MTADTETRPDAATVRAALREAGVDVPDKGKLAQEHWDAYNALQGAPADDDFPEVPEERPAPPDRPRGGWRRRRREPARKPAKGKGKRVSLAAMIEDSFHDFASLAPWPPLQRCLEVEAPFAGVLLEDAIRGTVVDAVFQPVARYEQAANAVGGVIGLPLATLAAISAAPAPGEDPSQRFMGAVMAMRYSARLLARAGAVQAEQIIAHAEDAKARGDQADQLVNYILYGPPEPQGEAEQAAAEAEDAAIATARNLLGK